MHVKIHAYMHNATYTSIHALNTLSFIAPLPTADSPEFASTVTSEPSSLALDIVSALESDQNM